MYIETFLNNDVNSVLETFPKRPLHMDESLKNFLIESQDKIDSLDVIYKIGRSAQIIGRKDTNLFGNFEHVALYKNLDTDKTEERTLLNPFEVIGYVKRGAFFSSKNRELTKKVQGLMETINTLTIKNKLNADDSISRIKSYSLSLSEVKELYGCDAGLINTGDSSTMITARDTFWLRLKGYLMGADALIDAKPSNSPTEGDNWKYGYYKGKSIESYEPGNAIATPIYFK